MRRVKNLVRVHELHECHASALSSTTGFEGTLNTHASMEPRQRKKSIRPHRKFSVISTTHSFSGKARRRTRQARVNTSVTGKMNRLNGQKSGLEYNGKNLRKNARPKHWKSQVRGRQEYGLRTHHTSQGRCETEYECRADAAAQGLRRNDLSRGDECWSDIGVD